MKQLVKNLVHSIILLVIIVLSIILWSSFIWLSSKQIEFLIRNATHIYLQNFHIQSKKETIVAYISLF